MRIVKKSLLSVCCLLIATGAAAAAPASSNTQSAVSQNGECIATQKITYSTNAERTRQYLVKNSSGAEITLNEAELDHAPKISIFGSARQVEFHGQKYDVDKTLVTQNGSTSTIDREMPQGDVDDDL
jgi:hypothetical protein